MPQPAPAVRLHSAGVPDDELVFESAAAQLRFHHKSKIVHHEFRSFVHGQPFREVLEQGLALMNKHGACRWLSDDRGNGPVTRADADWALNDWAPRVVAAGWKYWAVVMPEKVLGKMNMQRWMETYAKLGVTAQAYGDPVAALRWLQST